MPVTASGDGIWKLADSCQIVAILPLVGMVNGRGFDDNSALHF
jgi:hypothetical protein